jgi:hypothetical protein
MGLYGLFGEHSPEGCPLNNSGNRELVVRMDTQLANVAEKMKVKIQQQYHSGLEHTFLWIVDAEDGHTVQNFAVESGWAKFNSLKIVPLIKYEDVIESCARLGTT